eukprot:gene7130-14504_t
MTRICVKNLSKNTIEDDLKKLFGVRGEVTDVRLVRNVSGKSRQFAFVGFRSDLQAQEAQAYFNNSFLNNSRIIVEPAKRVDDVSTEQAKSRYTKAKLAKAAKKLAKNTITKVNNAETKSNSIKNKAAKDNVELDFMEVMKPRNQAQFWSNDEGRKVQTQDNDQIEPDNEMKESVANGLDSTIDDDDISENEDEYEAISSKSPSSIKKSGNAVVSDMDYLKSKISVKGNFSDSDSDDDNKDEDEDEDEDEDATQENIVKYVNKVPLKSQKKVSLSKENQNNSDDSDNDDKDSSDKDKDNKQNQLKETPSAIITHTENDMNTNDNDDEEDEDVQDSGRLFVRNLPYSCSEDELRELFAPYGPLTEIHLPLDQERKGKGFGFIQYMIPEHAHAAKTAVDGTPFQGRLLHIIAAKQPKPKENVVTDVAPSRRGPKLSAYQLKKEEERKKMAGKMDGWNSSYVRSDTVVDAVAEKYGMSRTDILDTSQGGGELAVRLAIAESQVIQENRDYLSAQGVDLTVLESSGSDKKAAKRSPTTILVKNLPHEAVEKELEDMFSHFGSLASFLIPKSKSLALVDFIEPSEARAAFKGLAYRKYKHVPLYLEWAPIGIINRQLMKKKPTATEDVSKTETTSSNSKQIDDGSDFSSIFVKNVNFETTEDDLREHVSRLGLGDGLRAVSLPKKQRPGTNQHQLQSMGFGFLEFRSSSLANSALGRLQGSVLAGHALDVKPSDKRITPRPSGSKTKTDENATNKLVVRNVAFQTTKKELKDLFSTFGNVKNVRIPKKMGGVHRGFAFVELTTVQEAEAAKNALANAHFYGRHLVIEWAKDDEHTIDELRKRASADEGAIRMEKKRMRIDDAFEERDQGMGDIGEGF